MRAKETHGQQPFFFGDVLSGCGARKNARLHEKIARAKTCVTCGVCESLAARKKRMSARKKRTCANMYNLWCWWDKHCTKETHARTKETHTPETKDQTRTRRPRRAPTTPRRRATTLGRARVCPLRRCTTSPFHRQAAPASRLLRHTRFKRICLVRVTSRAGAPPVAGAPVLCIKLSVLLCS